MNFKFIEEQERIIKDLIDSNVSLQFNYEEITRISRLATNVPSDIREIYPQATNEAIKEWQKEKDLHKYLSYFCKAFSLDFDKLDKELTDLINYVQSEKDDYVNVLKNRYIDSYIKKIFHNESEMGQIKFLLKLLENILINIESEDNYIEKQLKPFVKSANYEKIINISKELNQALTIYISTFIDDFESEIIYFYLMLNDQFLISCYEDMNAIFSFTATWMQYYTRRLSEDSKEYILSFLNTDFYNLFLYCYEIIRYDKYADIDDRFFTNEFYPFLIKVIQSDCFSIEENKMFIEKYIFKMTKMPFRKYIKTKFKKDILFNIELSYYYNNLIN